MKADLYAFDINILEDGHDYKAEERHVLFLVRGWINRNPHLFKGALVVGIEKQMKGRFKLVAIAIAATLAEKGIPVRDIAPKSVRSYFGHSGTSYQERKKLSLTVNLMSEEHKILCRRQFNGGKLKKKEDSEKVDAYEAAIIAMYLRSHYKKVIKPLDIKRRTKRIGIQHEIAMKNVPMIDPVEVKAHQVKRRKKS